MTKVVVHVDDPKRVALAVGNVQNLRVALPATEVIVVVNGPAITSLTTAAWQPLLAAGVEIDACHNAMVSHQLTASMLPAGVVVVPAGVARIVTLQASGAAYLKP